MVWLAATILGLRAFTSQLLCEQVVGRGLRRSSYRHRCHRDGGATCHGRYDLFLRTPSTPTPPWLPWTRSSTPMAATPAPACPGRTPGSSPTAHGCADELLGIEPFDTLLEAQVLVATGKRVQRLPSPLRPWDADPGGVRSAVPDQPAAAVIAGGPTNGVWS